MSKIRWLLAALVLALVGLVPVLGSTSSAGADPGTILAAAQWLRWLYHDRRRFANVAMVRERLTALASRLEGFRPPRSTIRG